MGLVGLFLVAVRRSIYGMCAKRLLQNRHIFSCRLYGIRVISEVFYPLSSIETITVNILQSCLDNKFIGTQEDAMPHHIIVRAKTDGRCPFYQQRPIVLDHAAKFILIAAEYDDIFGAAFSQIHHDLRALDERFKLLVFCSPSCQSEIQILPQDNRFPKRNISLTHSSFPSMHPDPAMSPVRGLHAPAGLPKTLDALRSSQAMCETPAPYRFPDAPSYFVPPCFGT